MITWRLDRIRTGSPRDLAYLYINGVFRASVYLTHEEYHDLAFLLATEPIPALPCARCGRPVDAGHATHPDCQPLVCRFCTQCARQLGAEEQAAGCRVCLVGCAPLSEGITGPRSEVVITVGEARQSNPRGFGRRNPHCSGCGDERGGPFGHEISECLYRAGMTVEELARTMPQEKAKTYWSVIVDRYLDERLTDLEAGESEGPDIATSSTAQPQQPAADPLGPPPFVPEQRQGGESL